MSRYERHAVPLYEIADYWAGSEEESLVELPELKSHWIGWGEPFCFACGWLAPVPDGPRAWARPDTGGWLERAHLKDHALGGSGHAANIVPLCHLCHDAMPMQETRQSALEWVRQRESALPYPDLWQMFTDEFGRSPGGQPRQTKMFRLKSRYLEWLIGVEREVREKGFVMSPGPLPVITEAPRPPTARRRRTGPAEALPLW